MTTTHVTAFDGDGRRATASDEPEDQPAVAARAEELFERQRSRVFARRDRAFAVLMGAQWVFAVALAFTYSPYAWAGKLHTTHLHVYFAIFVGGAISGTTILLTLKRPGWVVTRHTVAIAQMLWSALLIHLTGGRIETHFHVFGSLAFLAFYRDWKVIVTATSVVFVDHLLRGLTWPESVYGVSTPEWWRFLEHASWMAFEDLVLVLGIHEHLREMRAHSTNRAQLESLNASIERKIVARTEELARSREQYRALAEGTRSVPWQWNAADGRFTYVGPGAAQMLGVPVEAWLAPGFLTAKLHPDDAARALTAFGGSLAAGSHEELEVRLRHEDGSFISVRCIFGDSADGCVRGFLLDVTEQRRLELELHQAQRLESVGRLAAGIAHEINTPVQFVNDSVHFVREAFTATLDLVTKQRAIRVAAEGHVSQDLLSAADDAEAEADLDYVAKNVPRALDRSIEGLSRVALLVKSMKEFAHPDRTGIEAADLNRALQTTLTIARHEYKYVADVETDFDELPPVQCHLNDLNQAFLHIVVNAAQAIADVHKATGRRGTIRLLTRRDGDHVVVAIADTGCGIAESAKNKIFEPFFTTKDVGSGAGQGLSIARSVIVAKHGGTLTFESEVGVGTTFAIRIPIKPPSTSSTKAVAA